MRDTRSKSEILGHYKKRSVNLVSSHINNIAESLSQILIDDYPYDVPEKHRKEVDKFRGGLSAELWTKNPNRNTKLREMYEEVANSALVLLDGHYDETGASTPELLTRWVAYAQRATEYGFDIGDRIILLDGILGELIDPTFSLDYAVNQLLRQQGIIGSMFAKPPSFTNKWKAGYIIWSVASAATDVINNLPEMRYSGGN